MGTRSRRVQRQWLRNVALAALTVAVIALVAYTLNRGSVSAAQLAANSRVDAKAQLAMTPPTEAALPQVAFLGDSYTGGSNMNISGTASLYSTLLAAQFHFSVDNFGVGGTGFVAPGQTNQPFGVRVPDVVALQPDVVVVEGGHNDGTYPEAQVQAAARDVLSRLHAGLPKAKIIVIGPIWPSGDVPQIERNLDGDLRQLAASVGARFVDPIADGWFSEPYTKLIGSDGTHPTDAGHARIAHLLEPVFAATVPKVAS
jgi:lysophospholipase L1-like esterase